ncbi:MAG TPA: hypothetical protein VFI06_13420 [Chitinophagaceae bacterium]|nr:hypothetical protein [Chitinophagaceae bacterium]
MKFITLTLLLFGSQELFGQFKKAQKIDTLIAADLKLYPNKKFKFHDIRNQSCWLWMYYQGNWQLNEDTLEFTWEHTWEENSDTIISRTDLQNKYIVIEFRYDDGKPVANVKTSFSCQTDNDPKIYYSDLNGKIKIPKISNGSPNKPMCALHCRMLYYEVKNEIIKISSNTSIDYYAAPLSNIFTIIIKKKPRSYTKTETKKYLVKTNSLLEIDGNENYSWGNFKFLTWGNFNFLTPKCEIPR